MCDQPIIIKVGKGQVNEGRKKFPMNSVRIKPSNGLYIYHSRRLSNLWWNFGDLKSHFLRSGFPEQSLKLFRVTSSVAISPPKELIFLLFIFFLFVTVVTLVRYLLGSFPQHVSVENQSKGFGGSTSWYTENISRGGSYTTLRTANLRGQISSKN
ncbi:hypothetical protein NC651_035745 [Populus alba x Populus x berolinensis]|nr:hypothetical protein NC651_035745 [Populus alba x Populus x berolinensis]